MTPVPAPAEATRAGTAPAPAEQSILDQLTGAVAEKPRLAPGVRLAGQMQESAFEQPPWLIDRTGRGYVQVPRPLYDIAERADGEHTLNDIAREVAEADKLPLSADNVKQLIATQLIPNGVVSTRDGRVVEARPSTRSTLAIARVKTIDPHALDGLTRALQIMFWPPVLLLLMLASVIVQGWFYFVHGTGASLHDAFYLPGFILMMLSASSAMPLRSATPAERRALSDSACT